MNHRVYYGEALPAKGKASSGVLTSCYCITAIFEKTNQPENKEKKIEERKIKSEISREEFIFLYLRASRVSERRFCLIPLVKKFCFERRSSHVN